MIKFDFRTYVNRFIDKEEFQNLYNQKDFYLEKLKNSSMIGWTKEIDENLVSDIKKTAKNIKENFDCLVVIGIGGSFLGSCAFENIFKSYFNDKNFEIIYAGTNLSSKYLDELLTSLSHQYKYWKMPSYYFHLPYPNHI